MEISMKMFKPALLSATLLIGLAVHSPKSEATLALAFAPAGPIGVLIMVPTIVYSAVLMADGLYESHSTFGINNAIWGLIIFDKNTNEVEFREISNEESKSAGLTTNEKEAFNTELVRINLSMAEMNSTLANASKENLEATKAEALSTFKADVSPEALSAVQKILTKSFVK
jgi:hypothetical protein